MSLSLTPLTHRPRLSRLLCPHCLLETIHKAFTCLHCGHDHPPPRKHQPAYGARLVISKKRDSHPIR